MTNWYYYEIIARERGRDALRDVKNARLIRQSKKTKAISTAGENSLYNRSLKMSKVKLHNTIKIKASPDKAWAIVGDLTGVTSWVPGVTSARMEGMKRACNHGEIQEEISDYSDEKLSYRYAHIQVPLPVKNSRGRFAVEAGSDGSLVVWDAEFEVLDPAQEAEVASMVDKYYKQALEALRQQIE